MGHWAKECPNRDKSPKMICYKCKVGILGVTLPSGPSSLKVKHQAFPHNGSIRLKQPTAASLLSQITVTGLEPRVQLDKAGRSENFLVDTGDICPDLLLQSLILQNMYHLVAT